MKCNDCVPILSRWITESEVDLCPKHAMVDDAITALERIRDKSREWAEQERKQERDRVPPWWNLGDIATAALIKMGQMERGE